jgi:hypothetical protein
VNRFIINTVLFLLAFAVIFTAGPVSALTSAEDQTDQSAILNSPEEEPIPYEPFIRTLSGRLSVEVINAPFGEVMQEVAMQAGFEALISSDIAAKSLTTSFRDMDLERGIQRLLTLINHRNYFIFYDAGDVVKKIEVYGAVKAPQPATPTKKRRPSIRSGVPSVPTYRPGPSPRPSPTRRTPGATPTGRVVHTPRAESPQYSPSTEGQIKKYDDSSDVPFLAPV